MKKCAGSIIVSRELTVDNLSVDELAHLLAAGEIVNQLEKNGMLAMEKLDLPWQPGIEYQWALHIPSEQERWRNGDE